MKSTLNSLAIILIGNELLNGAVQDKNAKLLLEKLSAIKGLRLEVLILPDDELAIVQNIQRLTETYQVIITSGGLGPTTDDITVSSISKAFNKQLAVNVESKNRLEEKYRKRGRPLTENSYKQVLFPQDAIILSNEVGTADSCIIPVGKSFVCSFPGVPKEFEFFTQGSFWSWLESTFHFPSTASKSELRFFGLSEAFIGSKIESLKLPQEITVAYRPHFPEILVILTSNSLEQNKLNEFTETIVREVKPEFIFSRNHKDTLPQALLQTLASRNITIATAESCTGGRIASEITKIPGSSKVFNGGFVTYSNEMKTAILDIQAELLKSRGAVSEEVAKAMAENARVKTNSDYGVSTTGIAGPDGGSERKPVGLIYIGISSKTETKSFKLQLPWDRSRNQVYTTWYAMNLVWRNVMGFEMTWESK